MVSLITVASLVTVELYSSYLLRKMVNWEELDRQVREYLQVLRKNGAPVNTAIVIACGDGIVRSEDVNLLAVNGGDINWGYYLI